MINKIQAYITKYADHAAAQDWCAAHILNTSVPPMTFWADGVLSTELTWEKICGEPGTVTDYPQEAPFVRVLQPITYVCAERQLRIEMTLTTYPGYPVIEYEGTLYHDGTGHSCPLRDLQAIDARIDRKDSVYSVHAMKGSLYGSALIAGTDYAPMQKYLKREGDGLALAVTTGKPSETYLPYFNMEDPQNNTGVIAILNWQGSWKASFTRESLGVKLCAGQYETDFVLQGRESARFPGIVLLFYKGDYRNGQNVYRRWIYQCNLFREQGKHMKNTNVLLCSPTTSEAGDLASLDMYKNQTNLLRLVDKYNIDAGDATHGWYETQGQGWNYVGNWTHSREHYPRGLKPVSEAVKDAGLQFALWFEPERLYQGTQISKDLKGSIIAPGEDGVALASEEIPDGQLCLINYGDERAVEYVVRLLHTCMKEYGVDQYRQDYNIRPAAFWSAQDRREEREKGIPRRGLTENHACTGYLAVWSRLQKLNPGMYYDACASGGARYDLSTMRYAFLHTRSDEWYHIENAQSQAYGAPMWFLYCGTGFTDLSTYDVRSHIGNSIGVGVADPSQAPALECALQEWTDLASYLFYDYYPLTGYAGTSRMTMAMQYDSPEDGRGMVIAYFRQKDSLTVAPCGLDPDATYILWNRDDRTASEKAMTGAQILAGLRLESDAKTALVYEYCLAEGENTEDFQTKAVATGLGSTDFDAAAVAEVVMRAISVPVVRALYEPNGMSDAALAAAYAVQGDDRIAFVGYDYMSAGSIYAISKNIYEGVPRSGECLDSGWESLKKGALSIEIPGGWYPFAYWDGTAFVQQPYVKEIGGTYFLWLTNTIGLSDIDGGWRNFDVRIRWTNPAGVEETSEPFAIHCEGQKAQRVHYVKPADLTSIDTIYRIDEAIFGSLSYTGYGVELEGSLWYEVDMARCGYITSLGRKTPDEKRSIQAQTTMFDVSDGVQLYTQCRDGEYLLYFRNAAFMGARTTLVWIDAGGQYGAQTFLVY